MVKHFKHNGKEIYPVTLECVKKPPIRIKV